MAHADPTGDGLGADPEGAPRPGTDEFAATFHAIADQVGAVVRGKRDVVELALVGLFAEGHLLLEDVPGVGKTSLAKAIARSIGGTWRRIQFTPDLLPSDVTGVSVWDRHRDTFEFRAGSVFANVVLADEINRASPKTQSALLEAMEERQVTVDETTHRLGRPFMVIATQNPVELEGTYPLPEAQLDRFLLRLRIGYPSRDAELDILTHHEATDPEVLAPVVDASRVRALAGTARSVHVARSLREYLVELVDASRRHRDLLLGASPRATLALQRASRVLAASVGRDYVIPDDVKRLAPAVLAHRLVLTPDADLRGVDPVALVDEILQRVPVGAGEV